MERSLQTIAADDEPALDDGGFDAARALGVVLPRGEYALHMQDFSESKREGELENEGCVVMEIKLVLS